MEVIEVIEVLGIASNVSEEFKAKKGLMHFDEYFKGIIKRVDAKRKKRK